MVPRLLSNRLMTSAPSCVRSGVHEFFLFFGEAADFAELKDAVGAGGGEEVEGAGDDTGPAGLMAGAEAGSVVAVEVFVELDVIAPEGIFLEFALAAIDGPRAVFVLEENAGEAAGDFLGDLVEVHLAAGAGGAFDGEVVAIVGVVLEQRADDEGVDGHPDGTAPV